FFSQAEDGIRDFHVTGVQTCALPIYRGYATRKLGRTDEGIGYYQRALAIAPDYAKAREYLGEAWMVKGRPDLAKEQLKVIAGICGQDCEEYRDLRAAIDGHPES